MFSKFVSSLTHFDIKDLICDKNSRESLLISQKDVIVMLVFVCLSVCLYVIMYLCVSSPISHHTVQITFIFIGQTHLVFGKRVCTCVMKHSNAFRTFLNWLKNSKRVWHERKLHIMRVPLFANFDR